MTDDPLNRYADMLERAHAPEELSREVLNRIEREQASRGAHAAPPRETSFEPAPFSVKRRRFKGLAIAACLALLAIVVSVSLAFPHLGQQASPFGFAVKAYGSTGSTPLAMGMDGRILFEADILFRVPAGQRYAEEGVYTGCLFRIEGEGIVRVRAHVDRGELYRYVYDEFSLADDPGRWTEARAWTTEKIGQGDRFASYDLVQPVNIPGTDEQDSPDRTAAVKCYQRLGNTVDVPLGDDERLTDYCFGLWTNEDVSATGYQDYIDTLDGAQLTVTVEKADGSTATKIIELSSADFKAKVISSDGSTAIELLPEIIEADGRSPQEMIEDSEQGSTWIHTLYGTVVEENDEAFPYAAEPVAELGKPLTKPCEPETPAVGAGAETAAGGIEDSWVINKNTLDVGESVEVRFPESADPSLDHFPAGSVVGRMTCGNVAASTSPPDSLYTEGAKLLDPQTVGQLNWSLQQHGDNRMEDNGALSEGLAYVSIDVTVENVSDRPLQAEPAIGCFGTLKQANGEEYFAYGTVGAPLWVEGCGIDPSDPRTRFAEVPPGEARTFRLVCLATVEELADPTFSFYYRNTSYGGRTTVSFLIGDAEIV